MFVLCCQACPQHPCWLPSVFHSSASLPDSSHQVTLSVAVALSLQLLVRDRCGSDGSLHPPWLPSSHGASRDGPCCCGWRMPCCWRRRGVALRPDTGCNASGSGRHGMAAEEPAAPPCCEAAPGPQAAAAAGGGSGSGSRPDGGAGGVGSSSSRKRAAEEAAPGDVHVRRVVARMLCSGE